MRPNNHLIDLKHSSRTIPDILFLTSDLLGYAIKMSANDYYLSQRLSKTELVLYEHIRRCRRYQEGNEGNGGLASGGDIDGNLTVNGDLTVTGKTELGDTHISGVLEVDELKVDGINFDSLHLTGTLEVDGETTLHHTTISDGADVTGPLHVDAKEDGPSTFKGGLEVDNLKITGDVEWPEPFPWPDPLELPDGTKIKGDLLVEGKVEATDGHFSNNLTVDNKTTTKDLEVTNDAHIGHDLTVDNKTTTKDLEVTNNATIENLVVENITITGTQTGGGSGEGGEGGEVGPNLHLTGTLEVDGKTTLGDTLDVDGKITGEAGMDLSGPLHVDAKEDGPSTVKGGLEVDNLKITGKIEWPEPFPWPDPLELPDVTIKGDLTVEGETTLKQTTITDGLGVTGGITSDTVTTTGDVTVGGDLDVAGDATFEKGVELTEGDLTITKGDLSVQEGDAHLRDTYVDGTLEVTGNTDLGGDLHVEGKLTVDDETTLNKKLTVTEGGADITGDVTITGTETVNGPLHVDAGDSGPSTFKGGLEVDKLTVDEIEFGEGFEWPDPMPLPDPLEIPGPVKIVGDLEVTGTTTTKDLHVTNSATFDGNEFTVNSENITFNENVTFKEDITVEGDSHLHNTEIDGTLHVTGETTLEQNVTIKEGDLIVEKGDVTINEGDLTVVEGDTHLKNTYIEGTLDVTEEVHFHNGVTIEGDTIINGELTVPEGGSFDLSGDVHIKGDLTVEGETTLNKHLTVSEGGADISGPLHVDAGDEGPSTFTGGLKVDDLIVDNIEFGENFEWPDPMPLPDPLEVGNLHVTGDLMVDGDTNLKSTSIEGDLSVNGDVTITGTETVNGPLHVDAGEDGPSTFKGGLKVDELIVDNIQFGEDFEWPDPMPLPDPLEVGNLHVTGDLTVDGDTNLKDTTVDGQLDVNGPLHVDAGESGPSTFTGGLEVDDLHVTGKLTVDQLEFGEGFEWPDPLPLPDPLEVDDLLVKGKLTVEGESVFKDQMTTADIEAESVKINQVLEVIGPTHLYNQLTVDAPVVAEDFRIRHDMRWTPESTLTIPLKSVAYGLDFDDGQQGKWVGVGSVEPYGAWTLDGQHWTTCTGLTGPMTQIEYGPTSINSGLFVALSQESPYVWWSEDGKSWSPGTGLPSSISDSGIYCGLAVMQKSDTTLQNSIFTIQTAQQRTSTNYAGYDTYWSEDGKTWNHGSIWAGYPRYRSAYRFGFWTPYRHQLVIFGDQGAYGYSNDGRQYWTANITTSTNESSSTKFNWIDGAWGNGTQVIIGARERNNIGVSNDITGGDLYKLSTMSEPKAINFANGQFMLILNDGSVYSSVDGETWVKTNDELLTSSTWNDMAFGKDRWVAVGETTFDDPYEPESAPVKRYSAYLPTPIIHVGHTTEEVTISIVHSDDIKANGSIETRINKSHTSTSEFLNVEKSAFLENVVVNDHMQMFGDLYFGYQRGIFKLDTDIDLKPYNWQAIAFGNGMFVTIALARQDTMPGTIAYSGDGKHWEYANVYSSGGYTDIKFGNGRFVVIGSNTYALVSIDGIHWDSYPTPQTADCLAYGNGMFVAVRGRNGASPALMYTYDGTEWWDIPWPFPEALAQDIEDIAYGNGIWMMCTGSYLNTIPPANNVYAFMRSFDGIHWVADYDRSSVRLSNWTHLAWGPVGGEHGTWVAANNSGDPANYSLDGGVTWAAGDLTEMTNWEGLIYGGGYFIAFYGFAGAPINLCVSPDGKTWLRDYTIKPVSGSWHACAYGNGIFVGVCNQNYSNTTYTLPGGVITPMALRVAYNEYRPVLTNRTTANLGAMQAGDVTANSVTTRELSGVQQINGMDIGWMFRTVMELKRTLEKREACYGTYFGLDPNAWKQVTIPDVYRRGLVAYTSASRLFVCGQAGIWAYSDDNGLSWTKASGVCPTGAMCYGHRTETSNGTIHTVVGIDNQSGNCSYYRLNSAGTSWGWVTAYRTDGSNEIAFGTFDTIPYGTFVSVSPTVVYVSPTGGADWTKRHDGNYKSVCFGRDRFVAVGPNDSIYSVDRGLTWETSDLEVKDWVKVRYFNYGRGRFVALSADGWIAQSYDGISWTSYQFDTFEADWSQLSCGNGIVLITTTSGKYRYTVDLQTYTPGEFKFNGSVNDLVFGLGQFMLLTDRANGIYLLK